MDTSIVERLGGWSVVVYLVVWGTRYAHVARRDMRELVVAFSRATEAFEAATRAFEERRSESRPPAS